MKNLANFLKYNNAVPLVLGFLFLGSTAAFAASPQAREAVLSSQTQVVSVDNRYIVGKKLDNYTPKVRIDKVTEDKDFYYVAYTFTTIDIVEYVWKDVLKNDTVKVSKADLGTYGDLGLYLTEQLKQIVDRELAYLKNVQTKESKQVSRAMVATTYGGLVGKFLDTKTEEIPGYTPVVTPPEREPSVVIGPADIPASGTPASSASASVSGSDNGESRMISLQVLGDNPTRVTLGAAYVDLGAYLDDPRNTNVKIFTYLNDVSTKPITIDTSKPGVYAIEYRATDPVGNKVKVRRMVLVGDVADPGGAIDFDGEAIPKPPKTEEEQQSEPAPEPEPTPEPQLPEPEPEATSTPTVPEPEPIVETEQDSVPQEQSTSTPAQ